MDPRTLKHADYLDIIFDNRNKSYGGYQLRRTYGSRAGKALAIVYSAIAVLILLAVMKKAGVDTGAIFDRDTPTVFTDVVLPENKIIPPKVELPKPPPAKFKTDLFTKPELTDDQIPDDKVMPNMNDLRNGHVGIGTEGDSTDNDIIPDGMRRGKDKVLQTEVKPELPRRYVEQMPVFDGDVTAYLSSHVHYPDAARENGIEGRVQIEFIVNEDGSVSGCRVLKGIGGGCDEEAQRVVASMPKWKPGKQNGTPVKVYFSLVVKFVLQ